MPRSGPVPTLELERAVLDGNSDSVLVGIDEVGRGALAGPVCVGACAISRPDSMPDIPGLADSKLLTTPRRVALLEPISRWALAVRVGSASAKEIDEVGIIAALRLAALRAIAATGVEPSVVILDGSHDWLTPERDLFAMETEAGPSYRVITRVKADQTCASVAAASVVAKCQRDDIMVSLAQRYPDYEWDANKGYGSSAHLAAIARLGPCEMHRRSWKLPKHGEEPVPK